MSNSRPATTRRIKGLATSRGLVAGAVFIYRGGAGAAVPEYTVAVGDEAEELQRLKRGIEEARRDLESLSAVLRERSAGEDVRVFEGHLMMLEDPELRGVAERHIRGDRLNAEAAVHRAAERFRVRFERMNDPFFRERVRDLDDIERRLLMAISGFGGGPELELKAPSIVVADDLTPSETVRLPREFVLGFATNGGSTTSHVALLARAMGIPAVTGLINITEQVEPGEIIILDGTCGEVTLGAASGNILSVAAAVASGRVAAPVMTGGVRMCVNVHPGVAIGDLAAVGAQGIGLYRSEYLWLGREREPTVAEQVVAYRKAAEAVRGLSETASATIRLLDIGGDKLVGGLSEPEPNPFLGCRSIRYLLAHRQRLRGQLEAILRASAFGRLRLMYPMVACVEEVEAANAELAAVRRQLDESGVSYDRSLKVGAMVEVPAAALNAEAIAARVDFLSIGTNDLIQYTMAADRGNRSVAYLYQPLHPAVVQLVRLTVAAAKRRGIEVAVCGESAADPVVGVLWAALGVDELSMSPAYIPVVAEALAQFGRTDLNAYAAFVAEASADRTGAEVYALARDWLRRHSATAAAW